MERKKTSANSPGMMETLRSLQFGIVVLIAITVVAVIGTIIPQGQPYEWYAEQYPSAIFFLVQVFRFDTVYGSPLFLGLLGLFGLNLVLCTLARFPGVLRSAFRPDHELDRDRLERMPIRFTVPATLDAVEQAFAAGFRLRRIGGNRLYGESGRLGYLGATLVHVSLLLMLAGGMVSLITGRRGHVVLYPGESTSLAELPNGSKIPLGFAIRLDRFSAEYYEEHPDRPKSFTSSVTVTRGDSSTFTRDIRVNHPLMLNGFTLYQSSFGLSEEPAASALNDTARVEIRLKGAPKEMPPITTAEMVQGGIYPIPGFGDSIRVRVAEMHRDFRMGGGSGEGMNPAIKLDMLVRDEVRWSVYAFQKFPGLNMPMHEDLDFAFTMLDLRTGAAAGNSTEPQYYTVLGAVRDRGIPLMWMGAILMMAGLFFSFYLRPRRLWALAEEGSVLIGAQTKGETDTFRRFIERTIGHLNSSR